MVNLWDLIKIIKILRIFYIYLINLDSFVMNGYTGSIRIPKIDLWNLFVYWICTHYIYIYIVNMLKKIRSSESSFLHGNRVYRFLGLHLYLHKYFLLLFSCLQKHICSLSYHIATSMSNNEISASSSYYINNPGIVLVSCFLDGDNYFTWKRTKRNSFFSPKTNTT